MTAPAVDVDSIEGLDFEAKCMMVTADDLSGHTEKCACPARFQITFGCCGHVVFACPPHCTFDGFDLIQCGGCGRLAIPARVIKSVTRL